MKMNREKIKEIVRKGYADIATQNSSCCTPVNSCCGGPDLVEDIFKRLIKESCSIEEMIIKRKKD